jgi:hypothetical protein
MSRFVMLVAVALCLPLTMARADDEAAAVGPYEDLLEVLAVHAWHLDDDLYRHAVPTDASGRNVFVVTLERLDGWKKRFPTRLPDVVDFARAQAFERVGAWSDAMRAYGQVAAHPGPLAQPAAAALEWTRRCQTADALPEDGATLQDVIDALDRKLDAWRKVADAAPDDPHRNLALVEIERLEVRAAMLLVHNRHALQDGEATAERALRALIERHPDSKLLPRHVLRLADFYAAEAEEYADVADRPLDFDTRTFDGFLDRALDAYQKLATWDGIPEKPIASARFDAMMALRDATHGTRE